MTADFRGVTAFFKVGAPALLLLCMCTSAFAEWGKGAPSVEAPSAAITLKDLDALRKAETDAWEKMPLTVRRALFVNEKAQMTGAWSERSSNVFKPGEKLRTYVEPVGYTWKPHGDMLDFGVSVDFILKSADGKILGGQEGFSNVTLSGHEKIQEFMLNLTLSSDGIPPGRYIVEYKLHDQGSDKVVSFDQPFTIAE